jgi:hypothetical protein
VACRVVGGVVLPAVPDHVEPCSGEDADGVRVVVISRSGLRVEVGRPERPRVFRTLI